MPEENSLNSLARSLSRRARCSVAWRVLSRAGISTKVSTARIITIREQRGSSGSSPGTAAPGSCADEFGLESDPEIGGEQSGEERKRQEVLDPVLDQEDRNEETRPICA